MTAEQMVSARGRSHMRPGRELPHAAAAGALLIAGVSRVVSQRRPTTALFRWAVAIASRLCLVLCSIQRQDVRADGSAVAILYT